MIKKETDLIQKEIDVLKPYEAVVHEKDVVVKYTLDLTMIDG